MTVKEKKLETLVAVNMVCAVLFLVFKWKVAVTVGLLISLCSLLSPPVLNLVHKIWDIFFTFLAAINTRILLGIVFYFFLTPVSILKRIFSKDQPEEIENNFQIRNHIYIPDDLKRMG